MDFGLNYLKTKALHQRELTKTTKPSLMRELGYLHEPVHGPEEADILHGGLDGGEDDHHEDQGGAGHAGRGHGGRSRGQTENIDRELTLEI